MIVIPGRPRDGFLVYLLLWPLVGLAFNGGDWWLTAMMVLLALSFWSLMKSEIATRPELERALASESHGRRFARYFASWTLIVVGFVSIYLAHVALFPELAHGYRAAMSDPDLLHASSSQVVSALAPHASSLADLSGSTGGELVPAGIWSLDREQIWHQSWLAALAPFAFVGAAFLLTARREHLRSWSGWIPAVRSMAALIGSLLLVHAACAIVGALRIENGPLAPVLVRGTIARPELETKDALDDAARRILLALIERKYTITTTAWWSVRDPAGTLPQQQVRVLFADPESPLDRWRLTWAGPRRVLPHAVFVVRGPLADGSCSVDCDLGDVPQDAPERRAWTEWCSTLLR